MSQTNPIAAPAQARWLPQCTDIEMPAETIRIEQKLYGCEPCFMTEKRLLCKEMDCQLRARCCRLVAVWRR